MNKVAGLLLTLILLSSSAGCLADEIQEELEVEEAEDNRFTFALPTLGRDVDGVSMLDLTTELEQQPVLLFWVSSQCQGCHEWTEGIRDNNLNYSVMQPITIHRYGNFESEDKIMQVYGNNSSDHYSPWPVVTGAHSRLALDFDTREPSELSVVEAFGNLPTPSVILLDKNGNIVWEATSYWYSADQLEEAGEIAAELGD
ncbi:MAG: peroxiredoxin family protein [Candidatus Thalassarchaeaceae archaeon]|nr:MAG: hypothetical protein CND66_02890 [Marine Group II euryarchaeote MED-G37]|tara:strand:+ start:228 stop:827 length:600 start_codon:yes stop_codon:yes gene_type:complete